MIEVRVRVPQVANAPAALARRFQDGLALPGGIDDRSLPGDRIGKQVCIGLYRAQREGDDFQHRTGSYLVRADRRYRSGASSIWSGGIFGERGTSANVSRRPIASKPN